MAVRARPIVSKNGTSSPLSPCRITSRTGAVSDPTTRQPALSASISDQDRTNG